MDESILVDLGPENGTHRFRSLDELVRWVERERAKWSWIQGGDPGNSANRINTRFDALLGQIISWRAQGQPLSLWKDNLPPFFHPTKDGILLLSSPMGREIETVRDAYGPLGGAVAHSALRGWAQITQMDTTDLLRPFLAATMPAMLGPDVISATLKKERANTAALVRRITAQAEDAEANRAAVWQKMLLEARKRSLAWTRKLAVVWDRQRRASAEAHRISVESIDAVKAAYNEFMHLQAPAEYWRSKAAKHQTAEKTARRTLYVFFPVALIVLAVAFVVTGVILLRPGPSHPTPVYFVVSAGLATFAGVIFWIGRLLTRLYLSEHHLRKDAEEREVMTTTYLALTRDQAAEEKDRHIILTALFRNSADGIVKDENVSGSDLPSLLARAGMGGR